MSEPRLKLVVDKGPHAGSELRLREGAVTVGRDPRTDMVLKGDQFVSGEHARIVSDENGAVLHNLSPNGTLINGNPVNVAPLVAGDKIAIGVVHLLSVLEVPESAAGSIRQSVGGAAAFAPARTAGAFTETIVSERRAAAGSVKTSPPRTVKPEPAVTEKEEAPAREEQPGRRTGPKIPMWLKVYLVLIGIAMLFFGALKLTDSGGETGLKQVSAQEEQYANARKLPTADTERLINLLETAAVHERRGDLRSAYEVYREMLGVRQPIEPRSPAYRYAAARMAALGPK